LHGQDGRDVGGAAYEGGRRRGIGLEAAVARLRAHPTDGGTDGLEDRNESAARWRLDLDQTVTRQLRFAAVEESEQHNAVRAGAHLVADADGLRVGRTAEWRATDRHFDGRRKDG
jgi:hypothetical protein